MITALLTFAFVWSLSYGRVPQPDLLLLCAGVSVALTVMSRHRHRHEGSLSIDALAQRSRLRQINPTFKFWTILTLMVLCVASPNAATGVFLMVAAAALAVLAGGLPPRQYIRVLTLPVSFLLIGGIALLFEVSPGPTGVFNIPVFGAWLTVSAAAQARTALIVARAFGAVSCLILLSLTTPMSDIIGVLRRARCPDLVIDLMYLVYRYIFILLSLHREMRDAAKSRLGFRDYRTSLRATGQVYANLLARSYHFAGRNFDAMESRCYDTGIRFLEQTHGVTAVQTAVSVALLSVSVCLSLLPL